MNISEIINENLICLELMSPTKHSVIFELVQILEQENVITSTKSFLEDVIERENLSSTGIGYGIAIPHAKSRFVKKPALVFGRSEKGIDFQSMDHEKVYLFFMIAMPEEGSNAHLKILAELSRKLMKESFRDALMHANSKKEVLAYLIKET